MDLKEEIEEAENRLAQLRLREAAATCAEAGHRWEFRGGSNAGCDDECSCSVAVHSCTVCGACDYGQPDRPQVIAACLETRMD